MMVLSQLQMDVLHVALGCPPGSAFLFSRREYETTRGSVWDRVCKTLTRDGLMEQDQEAPHIYRVTAKGVKSYVAQRPRKRKH